jgi:hypothetical protein
MPNVGHLRPLFPRSLAAMRDVCWRGDPRGVAVPHLGSDVILRMRTMERLIKIDSIVLITDTSKLAYQYAQD